jgi:integrase/recombinase XerD
VRSPGFLAGYSGNTRVSYTTDLRLFAAWCADNRLHLLEVRRTHLEMFARTMEQEGRMRSTVARRLSTLCSFYRYCHLEGLLARDPAANVRRPKVDPESRTLGVDRNELGALLVQAGLGSRRAHALISLLAMNGLPISEALGANIDDLDVDRGHRTLRVVPKGGKQATIGICRTEPSGTFAQVDAYVRCTFRVLGHALGTLPDGARSPYPRPLPTPDDKLRRR